MEYKNLDELISANLKFEIEHCGKKKKDITAGIGVSNAAISEYCYGRSQPTLANLSKLCSYIGVSADDILCVNRNELK